MNLNPLKPITRYFMTIKYNREVLNELKEFLTERMVDNMSTKDLEEYVSNDLFNYFDKLGEHEFLEEARNYWDDSFDEVVAEVKEYMKCDFKQEPREVLWWVVITETITQFTPMVVQLPNCPPTAPSMRCVLL